VTKTTLDPEVKTLSLVPTPPVSGDVFRLQNKHPTIHLKTLHDVRIEMAKVYRAVRTGQLESQEGSRLVYMLSALGKAVEAHQVSERLDAIDRVLKRRQ